MLTKFKNRVRKFHDNEAGLEALQVVMILAVAAVALIVVQKKWKTVKGFFNGVMGKIDGEGKWN